MELWQVSLEEYGMELSQGYNANVVLWIIESPNFFIRVR